MDLKMPDLSHEVWPTEKRLLVPVENKADSNDDSPQEIQEREEFAAELEAMMDAAVEAEAAGEEACIQSSDVEMGMNVDQTEETATEGSPQKQQEYEKPQSEPNPTPVLPPIAPPLLSTAPLKSDPAPRYPYLNRPIRVPISPAQKIIAQQFLRKSRDYLRDTSAGGLSRLGDEKREAANLKIQTGTARGIPEPTVVTPAQRSTEYRQNGRQRSCTSQKIPAPAQDPVKGASASKKAAKSWNSGTDVSWPDLRKPKRKALGRAEMLGNASILDEDLRGQPPKRLRTLALE